MGKRRKKGRPVSGWLILDKSYGLGSTEAVSKSKWLLQAQKAGHAGTLDPLATGILPIAFGEATKTVPYIMDSEKRYRFTARWGETTTTDDSEGEVIARSDVRPSVADVEAVLPEFTGEIEQVPPQFSAIKVDGERAYDLAREGETVELPSRVVQIFDLEVVDTPRADEMVFEATTGKGAYVRSLVRDIAKRLGAEGHVSSLRRLSVGPFHCDDAVKLEAIEALSEVEERDQFLAPVSFALSQLPQAVIDGPQADKLRRGQFAVISPAVAKGVRGGEAGNLDAVFAMCFEQPVAICELDGLKLKPTRVFNL